MGYVDQPGAAFLGADGSPLEEVDRGGMLRAWRDGIETSPSLADHRLDRFVERREAQARSISPSSFSSPADGGSDTGGKWVQSAWERWTRLSGERIRNLACIRRYIVTKEKGFAASLMAATPCACWYRRDESKVAALLPLSFLLSTGTLDSG